MAAAAGFLQDRWYQSEAVDAIWSYFREGGQGNPVVAMPTGTGKSVVIARFLQSVYQAFPFQRVMMLTHVKELIQQNFEKLMALWAFSPAGVYSAGLKSKDATKPITFAGIQSVWKLAALFGHIDLLIIDEVHLVPAKDAGMYRTFIDQLKKINPHLKLIGLTATPWRLGQGRIIDPIELKNGDVVEPLFTDICYDLTGVEAFNRLIAEGYIMPLRAKRLEPILEADGVHTRGGEYIESELQQFVDAHEELTWRALDECRTIAALEGRNCWLTFSTGIQHAHTICGMLDQMGISNGAIYSGSAGRDALIKAHKAGEVTAVVNNNVLTTGYDNPRIDLLPVLRQTMSPVLWGQILGRGTRPLWATLLNGYNDPLYDLNTLGGRLASIQAGGKLDCRVMDYCGNTARLGPINDPVIPRRKGKGSGDAPVKACPSCDEWVHASLRKCPFCGQEFEFATKLKEEASSHEIVRGDDPVVEVFKVDHVSISEHKKAGMPPSVKLSYYCGLRSMFADYILPQHERRAQGKSRRLWSEMGGGEFPETTQQALEQIPHFLTMPTHLRVWTNKKYPEILARCYDGTAWGAEPACAPPSLETAKQTSPIAHLAVDELDEQEVPF